MTDSHMEYAATSRRARSLCTFKWTISDFDTVCPMDEPEIGRITSPAFTAGEEVGKKSQWCISVAGNGGNAVLSLFRLAPEPVEDDESHLNISILCKYKVSIGNTQNVHLLTESGQHQFDEEDEEWGTELIKLSGLYTHNKILIENNKLRIQLEMEIEGAMACSISNKSLKRKRSTCEIDTLSTHLQNLFQSNEHSDVHLQCGGSSFYCHKLILTARSSVFKAMLKSESSEEESIRRLEIKNVDPKILSTILHYIYTGKVELPDTFCWTDVIRGADAYGLNELKTYCFERLIDNLSEENIHHVALIADTHSASDETKDALQKFFKSNMKTLMENFEFRELLHKHPKIFFPSQK